jgi:predicted GH43/DUF377 family glycosyl hydrolase
MNNQLLQDKVLLRPSDLQPLDLRSEIIGAFNPAAVRFKGEIILLVRVAEQPILEDPTTLKSPRTIFRDGQLEWIIDTFDANGVERSDPRKFTLPNGRQRISSISHLRLVRLSPDGSRVKEVKTPAALLPREPWEEFGIEDPRITQIGNLYYITYVAISRQMGLTTALMTTSDFKSFERHGIIFPTENKDIVLLPKKWKDQYIAYHRPVSHHTFDMPSIQTALSPDCKYWGKYRFLLAPRPGGWDSFKIGAGAPPIAMPQGWLLIYHGVTKPSAKSPGGIYSAGAALMALDNPLQLLARSNEPLIIPERDYEQRGFMPNVVFPTGALLSEDQKNLLLFCGAADEVVSLITIPLKSILGNLEVE